MSKLTEAGIINALNNKSWLYEGLKKNVRHEQRPPYHHDIEDEIIPDNLNGHEDSEDFWLDNSFGYRCPNCDSAFVSPEQIGRYDKIECPYCEAIIHPEPIDEDEMDEYELDDDEEYDDDDEVYGDEECDEDDYDECEEYDDSSIDEIIDGLEISEVDNFVKNLGDDEVDQLLRKFNKKCMTESYSKAQASRKAKRIAPEVEKMRSNKKYSELTDKMGDTAQGKKISKLTDKRKKLSNGIRKRIRKLKQQGEYAKLRTKRDNLSVTKQGEKKIAKKLNNSWSDIKLLQMDEKAVMAVLNETISQAFEANEEFVPFKVVDITRGSYKPVSDILILETVIQYEDGMQGNAEFKLDGVQSGQFELTETTGAFDFGYRYKIIGNSSIVNESIIIN